MDEYDVARAAWQDALPYFAGFGAAVLFLVACWSGLYKGWAKSYRGRTLVLWLIPAALPAHFLFAGMIAFGDGDLSYPLFWCTMAVFYTALVVSFFDPRWWGPLWFRARRAPDAKPYRQHLRDALARREARRNPPAFHLVDRRRGKYYGCHVLPDVPDDLDAASRALVRKPLDGAVPVERWAVRCLPVPGPRDSVPEPAGGLDGALCWYPEGLLFVSDRAVPGAWARRPLGRRCVPVAKGRAEAVVLRPPGGGGAGMPADRVVLAVRAAGGEHRFVVRSGPGVAVVAEVIARHLGCRLNWEP